jgi:hypothetical protein
VPVEPEPPITLTEADIRGGAVLIEILGENAAKRVVGAQRTSERRYGYGRAQAAIMDAIDRVLKVKSRREAEPLQEKARGIGVFSCGKAATFDEAVDALYQAIASGESLRWINNQKALAEAVKMIRWPDSPAWPEDGGSSAETKAIQEYAKILNDWSMDFSEVQLRAMGFDAREIADKWAKACRDARANKDRRVVADAVAAFESTGEFAVLLAAKEAVVDFLVSGAHSGPQYVAAGSRWCWQCVKAGHLNPRDAGAAPSEEWLQEQTDLPFLVRCAKEAHCQYGSRPVDFRPEFRRRLVAALPARPDPANVVVYGKDVIDHEGRILRLSEWVYRNGRFERLRIQQELQTRRISRVPHPEGWVTIRADKYAETGNGGLSATLYGPENYRALEVAKLCRKGSLDIRPWLENFGLHPNRGFGRFYFGVAPGAAHSSSAFVSVDDKLRERAKNLRYLPDPKDVSFTDDIWYLPARLVSWDGTKGHLVWDENAPMAVVYKLFSEVTGFLRRDRDCRTELHGHGVGALGFHQKTSREHGSRADRGGSAARPLHRNGHPVRERGRQGGPGRSPLGNVPGRTVSHITVRPGLCFLWRN